MTTKYRFMLAVIALIAVSGYAGIADPTVPNDVEPPVFTVVPPDPATLVKATNVPAKAPAGNTKIQRSKDARAKAKLEMQQKEDAAYLNSVVAYVKATVANGVAVSITEDASFAELYAVSVRDAILQLLKKGNHSPAAFEKAVRAVKPNQISGKTAGLWVANMLNAYDLYWYDATSLTLSSSKSYIQLLSSIAQGIDAGLTGNPPVVPEKPQSMWK